MEPINYITLIPFIACVFYFILLIILMGSRNNKIAKAYIYYIVAMIIWSLGSFVMKTNFPPGSLFWNRILCVGLISMPILFYNFTLVLTKIKNQFWVLWIGVFTGIFFIIANFMGLIMKSAYMDMVNNQFNYKLGPVAPIMAIWSLLYLILAFMNILGKVKSNEIPFVRVKLILIGLVLVIIGGLLNLNNKIGRYPLDIILNTINAVFIVYSIYRHKFLEIKLIVKKGIAYSLYTIILTCVYLIAIVGVQLMLSHIFGYSNITLTITVALLLAMIFQPMKNTLQRGIDRIFYKEKLKSQMVLKNFSEIINNILDLNEILDAIMNAVNKRLQPKQIHIALNENIDDYIVYDQKANEVTHLKINSDHPIVKWFLQGKSLLTISEIHNLPYFSSLWSIEKKQLLDINTELIVPIKFRDKLIGMLILSEKNGGDAYTDDELDLVHTVVNHAAAVIENAKLYEEAKEQAITDGLTKLYNHRYFHEILSEIVAKNKYQVFSIAMIDVDLFKFYNDLYGHSAGDRALVRIAQTIKENISLNDMVFRYGGEEFAVIFPNIEGEQSLEAIEKIRKAVESSFYNSSNYGEFMTVSAGVANYPYVSKTVEFVLDCADKAMYTAKQSGRNKAILYSDKQINNEKPETQFDLESLQDSIKSAYLSSIYALAATIDAKDRYTYGHSENVSNLAVILAKEAGFSPEKLDVIKNAGLLHDIGKIGIPENILTKPDKLTPDEYLLMKKHVDISITIIKHIPNLIEVIPAIMSHHEKYDGSGYPLGRKEENIPFEGRCLCIVDAFDAMISDRPYRKALGVPFAIAELKKFRGIQFDPKLTDLFINLVESGKLNHIIDVTNKGK